MEVPIHNSLDVKKSNASWICKYLPSIAIFFYSFFFQCASALHLKVNFSNELISGPNLSDYIFLVHCVSF